MAVFGSLALPFLAFIFSVAASLRFLSKSQRDVLLSYVPVANRGRRHPSAVTPPRSLSPTKNVPSPSGTNSPTHYKTLFPPSTRENLPLAAPGSEVLKGEPVNQTEFTKNLISFEADYRQCGPSTYTPMQISLEEVAALGDFPNYSALSGVTMPEPYKNFNIETALPRPYRPFRWAYHQTMSLTKLETDWWLELDKSYVETVQARIKLYEKHGNHVLDYFPGSELACKEIMEMALQFYCCRYPQFFSLNQDHRGYVFHNALLNSQTVIKDLHPLLVLLHNIPEDFAVMLRNPENGLYYFRAGMICSALGWNVSTKIGKQLKEIHEPIPDYKEKMEFSMDRFFSKMPPSKPIQRGSWGLEVDTPLYMPPGDPHELHRLSQNPSLELKRLNLRVDWQTLRRLPVSGAIVFNFKGLFTPMTEFRDEPYIPALVREILLKGKKNIMEYKSTWHVEHVALPKLKEWDEEQRANGIVEKEWKVRTLDESPWFPGWESKWHRQQGF